MDIKKEYLNYQIWSTSLKSLVVLNEKNKHIFIKEKRFEFFTQTGANDLRPKKPKRERRKQKDSTDDLPTKIDE